jgi:hypothetical protein
MISIDRWNGGGLNSLSIRASAPVTTLASDTLFDGCAFGMIAVSPNRRILGFTVFLPSIGDSHG